MNTDKSVGAYKYNGWEEDSTINSELATQSKKRSRKTYDNK